MSTAEAVKALEEEKVESKYAKDLVQEVRNGLCVELRCVAL